MNSRRDWLKCFGAGALIVPIIGAKADESNAAQLIETPRIKPVELFAAIPKTIDLQKNVAAVAVLLTLKDGSRRRLEIQNPEGWGTIEMKSSQFDMTFTSGESPISEFGSVTGGFSL